MKVAFLTLGCKVNSYETEKMKELFEEKNHSIVSFDELADVYIINTCTVTNIADRKSRKMLHRAKRKNSDAIVVATGCYVDSAQKKGEKDESVDLFIGNDKKDNIVELVEMAVDEKHFPMVELKRSEAAINEEHTRAYLKVQNGCNQFCTYCIIPYVRGPLKSKPVNKVVEEVKKLTEKGIKEIVLTGIHLSSYGVDFSDAKNFLELKGEPLLELISNLSEIEGISRIRLGSLEPRIITEDFVSKLSKMEKVCPHFHLSLQSGCDEILRRMNRHYSAEEYYNKTMILRKYYEHPAITTDIIVGFPMETEEEFEETCRFTEKVEFSQIHVFKYSRRHGTMADAMDGQIDESEKSKRSEILIDTGLTEENKYKEYFIGTEQRVLFEEIIDINNEKYLIGYNERYVRIAVKYSGDNKINKICDVHILGQMDNGILFGDLI